MLLVRDPFHVCRWCLPLGLPFIAFAVAHVVSPRWLDEHAWSLVGPCCLVPLVVVWLICRGRVVVVRVANETVSVYRAATAAWSCPVQRVLVADSAEGLRVGDGRSEVVLDHDFPGRWLLGEYLDRRRRDSAHAQAWLDATRSQPLGKRPREPLVVHRPWASRFVLRLGVLGCVASGMAAMLVGHPELLGMAALVGFLWSLAVLRWRHDLTDTVVVVSGGLVLQAQPWGWTLHPWAALRALPAAPRDAIVWYCAPDRLVAVRRASPTGAQVQALLAEHGVAGTGQQARSRDGAGQL